MAANSVFWCKYIYICKSTRYKLLKIKKMLSVRKNIAFSTEKRSFCLVKA